MKANMKLSFWIPFIFIFVVAAFLIQGFSALDVVMILGAVLIVGYFILGYVRRIDAIQIIDNTMVVKTPITVKEYQLSEISEIYFKERDRSVLKAVYQNEEITLCTDIYDVSILAIKAYLLLHYPHISEKVIETSKK